MISLMPKTISSSEIQKKYREVFDEVKKTKEPVIVLTGNKPDVAIVDFGYLENLRNESYDTELKDAMIAIKNGDEELKKGKTKVSPSLSSLIE